MVDSVAGEQKRVAGFLASRLHSNIGDLEMSLILFSIVNPFLLLEVFCQDTCYKNNFSNGWHATMHGMKKEVGNCLHLYHSL